MVLMPYFLIMPGFFDEANEYNEEIIMDCSYVPNLITWVRW